MYVAFGIKNEKCVGTIGRGIPKCFFVARLMDNLPSSTTLPKRMSPANLITTIPAP